MPTTQTLTNAEKQARYAYLSTSANEVLRNHYTSKIIIVNALLHVLDTDEEGAFVDDRLCRAVSLRACATGAYTHASIYHPQQNKNELAISFSLINMGYDHALLPDLNLRHMDQFVIALTPPANYLPSSHRGTYARERQVKLRQDAHILKMDLAKLLAELGE